ncbi:MAG: hypothetical protein ACRD0Y_07295 [Terriglobales bacterium]
MPSHLRRHLVERMADRAITTADLDRLRAWTETSPEVPEGDWFVDFGSFKLCGSGEFPKTFLLPGQAAKGQKL